MKDNKKGGFDKLLEMVKDKGFYIILGLCVVAIGVSGYVIFFTDKTNDIPINSQIDVGPVFNPNNGDDPTADQPKPNKPDNNDPVNTTPDPDEPTVDPGQDDKPDEKDKPTVVTPKAVAPTGGNIIREFSGDKLVFDETMSDWRTHNGTDYSCTQGDTVFCVRDGVVTAVYEDGLMGHTVSVEHSDGIITTYSGLSSVAVVKKGDNIKMGQAVGTAGGTAIAETNQPFHIHVNVTKDGKYIDIKELF